LTGKHNLGALLASCLRKKIDYYYTTDILILLLYCWHFD